MESLPLYVPDYNKWQQYFKKHMTGASPKLVNGKTHLKVIPSLRHVSKQDEPKVTLQVTSEAQSVVDQAGAKEKRGNSLKRAAGGKVTTTKKIRQTSNTPSKTAKVLRCTPVSERDIFS